MQEARTDVNLLLFTSYIYVYMKWKMMSFSEAIAMDHGHHSKRKLKINKRSCDLGRPTWPFNIREQYFEK